LSFFSLFIYLFFSTRILKNTIDFFSFLIFYYLDSRVNLQTPQSSIDETKQSSSNINRFDSTDTNDSQSRSRNVSVTDSESNQESRLKPLGNEQSVPESEDDIDRKFKKVKLVSSSN
jgi:hypothetical protein